MASIARSPASNGNGSEVSRLIRKLRHGAHLDASDERALGDLTRPAQSLSQHSELVPEGGTPRRLPVMIEGWGCRSRVLENGKRQITALYLPGDICEPFGVLPIFMDQAIVALTPARVTHLALPDLAECAAGRPLVRQALWWDLLMMSSIERERIVSLGRRSALERIGHLFCEIQLRLEMVGLADRRTLEFPLTQADLADLLGLTPVHVNRSLQEMRRSGLITLQGRKLVIHDLNALQQLSYFEPDYLHPAGARSC